MGKLLLREKSEESQEVKVTGQPVYYKIISSAAEQKETSPSPSPRGDYLAGGQKAETRQRAELSHQPCSQQLPRVHTVCAMCEWGRELQRAMRNSMGGETAGLFSIATKGCPGKKNVWLSETSAKLQPFFAREKFKCSQPALLASCLCENTERTKPALPAPVDSAVLLCLSLQAVISLGVKTSCSLFAQGLVQRGLRPSLVVLL